MTFAGGDRKDFFRQAGRTIFRRVEAREMLADNFFRSVALQALGTGVPGGDESPRIEREDGVIGDAFDQQPVVLLHLASLGQIARDFAETDQLPAVVIQPCDHHIRPEACAVLANAPIFVFKAATAGRLLQFEIGLARAPLALGIKDREVLSDDLLCLVALEALSSRIPSDNVARRIEHKNRVISRRFYHQPVDSFVVQRVWGRLLPARHGCQFCHSVLKPMWLDLVPQRYSRRLIQRHPVLAHHVNHAHNFFRISRLDQV